MQHVDLFCITHQNEIFSTIAEGNVAVGILYKHIYGRLRFAQVAPVLIDLAVGHFNSKRDPPSAFASKPHAPTYL